jgi:hypothetical protein
MRRICRQRRRQQRSHTQEMDTRRCPRYTPAPLRVQPKAWVAQLVEQRIENPRVAGSIPAPGTMHFPLNVGAQAIRGTESQNCSEPVTGARPCRSARMRSGHEALNLRGKMEAELGEPAGIRTRDLLIKSQLLYRLSYRLRASLTLSTKPLGGRGIVPSAHPCKPIPCENARKAQRSAPPVRTKRANRTHCPWSREPSVRAAGRGGATGRTRLTCHFQIKGWRARARPTPTPIAPSANNKSAPAFTICWAAS